MIEEFDFDNCRESSVLYQTIYKQVARKYKRGKYEEAAELALAYMQVMLCGETTTDDEDIVDLIEPYLYSSHKAAERYERKLQRTKESKIDEMRLDEIAALMNEGKKSIDISETLGIPRSTVSYRMNVIKDNYKELLNFQDFQLFQSFQSNDNDNDNDKDKDNDKEKEKEKENVVEFGQAEHQPASASASDKSSEDYILSLIKKYKPFKNNSGMLAFQEIPKFAEMEAINHYLSNHPEAIFAA